MMNTSVLISSRPSNFLPGDWSSDSSSGYESRPSSLVLKIQIFQSSEFFSFLTGRSRNLALHLVAGEVVVKESETSSRIHSPPPLDSPDSESALAMTRSTIFEPPPIFNSGNLSDNAMNDSAVLSHDGRFSDADSDADNRYDRYLEDSDVLGGRDPFHDNPGYLDSVIDAQFDDSDVES